MILNANNFEKEVLKADLPVLVDFWASWCPPCKMVERVVEQLEEDLSGRVKVGKLNVDQNPGIASRYEIKGVPTFILFVEGREVARRVGAQSTEQLRRFLEEHLASMTAEAGES
jgi:thioredoxin 1